MREATGNALLINIIVVFVIVFIGLLAGSINYSKAYKVKARIVNIIEDHSGYNEAAIDEINKYLLDVGYIVRSSNTTGCSCPADDVNGCEVMTDNIQKTNGYRYCVYRFNDGKIGTDNTPRGGYYYRVVAYMYFDIPIINEILNIPVYGETRSFR